MEICCPSSAILDLESKWSPATSVLPPIGVCPKANTEFDDFPWRLIISNLFYRRFTGF